MSSETEIRPFQVDVPNEAIDDLRRRTASIFLDILNVFLFFLAIFSGQEER